MAGDISGDPGISGEKHAPHGAAPNITEIPLHVMSICAGLRYSEC